MQLSTIFQSTRPSFLILTPICVFLGLSTALSVGATVNYTIFSLILIGAIAAHISVNTLNEYFDFTSGLDLKTEKTPFSGGSGALPANPEMANAVLATGLISLLVTAVIGIYLMTQQSAQILPIGIVGMIIIYTYTNWINRIPFLCLIAPGIGFGLLMVVGTHIVLTKEYSLLPWLAALVPFFLVNNLLLLNQYPDIEADKSVGRNHLPIAYGTTSSTVAYALFMLGAYLMIAISVVMGYFPLLSLIALIPMGLAIFSLMGAKKYSADIGQFPQYLGTNVAATLATPLLLGISLLYGF
ncbi:MAG: prenyltransferase [Gammaproteobacteria bacterium]|nr:prenyltransferase [Gammaproteobacteria bacterium]